MPNVKELVCASGHEITVQPWASSVPTVCPFTPCGREFLTPAQKAVATRKARQAIALTTMSPAEALEKGVARWEDDMIVWVG